MPDIIANRERVVTTFVESARELVKLGADVILPMGITQCPVHIKPDFLMKEPGVPVVEGIGAPIRLAHMLVHLKLNYKPGILAEVAALRREVRRTLSGAFAWERPLNRREASTSRKPEQPQWRKIR